METILANELWTNKLLEEEGGSGLEVAPWKQHLTLVLAWNPLYCLDVCDKVVRGSGRVLG